MINREKNNFSINSDKLEKHTKFLEKMICLPDKTNQSNLFKTSCSIKDKLGVNIRKKTKKDVKRVYQYIVSNIFPILEIK